MTTFEDTEYLHYLEDDDTVSREIIRINDLRRQIDELKAEKDILTERVAKELEAHALRTVGVRTPSGDAMRATVTRTPTRQVNLAHLRKVNSELYNKVTKSVLDTTALNRELNKGSFNEAEQHLITVSYSKPFLRFSDINAYAEDE